MLSKYPKSKKSIFLLSVIFIAIFIGFFYVFLTGSEIETNSKRRHSNNLSYTYYYNNELKEHNLFKMNIDFSPLPASNKSSKITIELKHLKRGINVSGKILAYNNNIHIEGAEKNQYGGYVNRLKPLSLNLSHSIKIHKNIKFNKAGSYSLGLILDCQIAENIEVEKFKSIYIYIPGNDELDNNLRSNGVNPQNIPRVSMTNTKAHMFRYAVGPAPHEKGSWVLKGAWVLWETLTSYIL